MLIQWLVFIHILSTLTFFLAHGSSVAMAFKIRKETDIERIKAMLDLSGSTVMAMFFSFLAMGLSRPGPALLFQILGQRLGLGVHRPDATHLFLDVFFQRARVQAPAKIGGYALHGKE